MTSERGETNLVRYRTGGFVVKVDGSGCVTARRVTRKPEKEAEFMACLQTLVGNGGSKNNVWLQRR